MILCTTVLRCVRRDNPDSQIAVVSPFPFVFEGNPHVSEVYDTRNPFGFYHKYVRGNQENVYRPQVYADCSMNQETPIIESLCKIFGTTYDGEPPQLFLSDKADNVGRTYVRSFEKPVVVLHLSAGYNKNVGKRTAHKDWPMELGVRLIERLQKKFQFVQHGVDPELKVEGVPSFWNAPYAEAFGLIRHAHSFVSVDSLMPHAAAALGTRGVVLFGSTSVNAYGHAIHKNISVETRCKIAPCGRPDGIYFDVNPGYYDASGAATLWECPDPVCMKEIEPTIIEKALRDLVEEIPYENEEPEHPQLM